MKARADAMLTLVGVMESLSKEDQVMLAHDVFNTWGGGVKHGLPRVLKHVDLNGKHVGKTRGFGSGEPLRRGVVDSEAASKKQSEVLEVLSFLNEKASKNYRPVEENLRFIRARLNTCSVEDVKGVIARKTREWLNTEHAKYLRPATLFNATKFEQYIGEQTR